MLVAATLKYADAVLKTLATSGSIGKPTVATDVIFALMCLYYLYVCVLYHVCVCVCVYVCVPSYLLYFCVFFVSTRFLCTSLFASRYTDSIMLFILLTMTTTSDNSFYSFYEYILITLPFFHPFYHLHVFIILPILLNVYI